MARHNQLQFTYQPIDMEIMLSSLTQGEIEQYKETWKRCIAGEPKVLMDLLRIADKVLAKRRVR